MSGGVPAKNGVSDRLPGGVVAQKVCRECTHFFDALETLQLHGEPVGGRGIVTNGGGRVLPTFLGGALLQTGGRALPTFLGGALLGGEGVAHFFGRNLVESSFKVT